MLKLTISDREPIWINLDKVLAVGPTTRGTDLARAAPRELGSTWISIDIGRFENHSRTSSPKSAKLRIGPSIKLTLLPVSNKTSREAKPRNRTPTVPSRDLCSRHAPRAWRLIGKNYLTINTHNDPNTRGTIM